MIRSYFKQKILDPKNENLITAIKTFPIKSVRENGSYKNMSISFTANQYDSKNFHS